MTTITWIAIITATIAELFFFKNEIIDWIDRKLGKP
jgi:hypothetical protein